MHDLWGKFRFGNRPVERHHLCVAIVDIENLGLLGRCVLVIGHNAEDATSIPVLIQGVSGEDKVT